MAHYFFSRKVGRSAIRLMFTSNKTDKSCDPQHLESLGNSSTCYEIYFQDNTRSESQKFGLSQLTFVL